MWAGGTSPWMVQKYLDGFFPVGPIKLIYLSSSGLACCVGKPLASNSSCPTCTIAPQTWHLYCVCVTPSTVGSASSSPAQFPGSTTTSGACSCCKSSAMLCISSLDHLQYRDRLGEYDLAAYAYTRKESYLVLNGEQFLEGLECE